MKKSVVLQAIEGNEKAVLSFEDKDDMVVGRVRLYNFNEEPRGILTLGFSFDGKVTKAGLTKSSNMLYTFQTDNENIGEKFSCAVVNSFQGKFTPLLFGSSDGKTKEDALVNSLGIMDKQLDAEEIENELDNSGLDFDEQLKEEIEKEIDKNVEDRCENCRYKKCFVEEEKSLAFYSKLKNQIDRLFEENPSEEYLEKIIPNSKWVKVEYEKQGDYYVIGLIEENGKLEYISYGVPGVFQNTPPKELSGYPVWLPLDSEKKDGFGYWLVYQNANTGESIKAIID